MNSLVRSRFHLEFYCFFFVGIDGRTFFILMKGTALLSLQNSL